MKVYLAGKVGGRKWEVVKPLSRVEWVASDGGDHSEHLWGGGCGSWGAIGGEDLRRPVADALRKIVVADSLVAYLDTNDSYGSIVELTIAAAYHKPCLLVVRMPPEIVDGDFNHDGHPVAASMADAYWFVSCLPAVRAALVESEAEATDVIRGFLLQTHRHIPKTRKKGE